MQLAARPCGLTRPAGLGSAAAGPCALPQRRLTACRPAQPQSLGLGSLSALPSSSSASSTSSVPAVPLPCLRRQPAAAAAARRQQRQQHRGRQGPAPPQARPRDPDALDGDEEQEGDKSPPTLLWRTISALFYLVPWIDSISLGRHMYAKFRNLLLLYFIPGPLAQVYFSSQFAPLIIFFVMFLSVVKNKKLHHFVRFNCMQAIMLDIVVMLFHILRAYLPAELKWSAIGHAFDMVSWTACMGTVVYCVFWTLRGFYSDLPFVSESVYIQVAQSDYA